MYHQRSARGTSAGLPFHTPQVNRPDSQLDRGGRWRTLGSPLTGFPLSPPVRLMGWRWLGRVLYGSASDCPAYRPQPPDSLTPQRPASSPFSPGRLASPAPAQPTATAQRAPSATAALAAATAAPEFDFSFLGALTADDDADEDAGPAPRATAAAAQRPARSQRPSAANTTARGGAVAVEAHKVCGSLGQGGRRARRALWSLSPHTSVHACFASAHSPFP
jgi:hypothetical protein